MYSAVAELKREGYDIRTVDVRHNLATARKFRVSAVPTFIYVVDGKEVARITGPTTKSKLRRFWGR